MTAREIILGDILLEGEELDRYAEYVLGLPDDLFFLEMQLLLTPGWVAPDHLSAHYRPAIVMWRSPDGKQGGPIPARAMDAVLACRNRLKEALQSEDPLAGFTEVMVRIRELRLYVRGLTDMVSREVVDAMKPGDRLAIEREIEAYDRQRRQEDDRLARELGEEKKAR